MLLGMLYTPSSDQMCVQYEKKPLHNVKINVKRTDYWND